MARPSAQRGLSWIRAGQGADEDREAHPLASQGALGRLLRLPARRRAAPLLWHRSLEAIASDFRFEVEYLVTGWTAYALIGLGLLFFVPVLVSIGRSPESRLYPRGRNAYAGWAISLYLLGLILASQVAAVTGLHPTP